MPQDFEDIITFDDYDEGDAELTDFEVGLPIEDDLYETGF